MPDPFPWVPPTLRGHGQYKPCLDSVEYRRSLYYNNYVIQHAPDLHNSGCFPDYAWITLCKVRIQQLGPPLLTGPRCP
eukprot:7724841-Pyramimonas_sp.AAC.1